jgi:hypothetical protein
MILNAVKSAEAAKRILANRKDLTPADIEYLNHVIEEGERAKPRAERFLREKEEQRKRLEEARRRKIGEIP